MTASRPITDSDLNAYVDGELDERTRIEVETWLSEHPEDALRVAAYREQRESLHRHFDPVLEEPVPLALRETVTGFRPGSHRRMGWQAAAAVVLLAVGVAGGWGARGTITGRTTAPGVVFAQSAVGAHLVYVPEIRHPVEVDAKQETHLVTWLSKRLGHPLRAPRLHSVGYRLIGGRLLPDSGRPAAQFMYEDEGSQRLTLYVSQSNEKDTAFQFTEREGASAFYWIDAPFAYALIGGMPRDDLLRVAHVVYGELAP